MEEKTELIEQMHEILGHVPRDTRNVLAALTHPDIIDYTKRYIDAMDKASKCTKFIAPWTCAREAEARYENIKYGWLGAGTSMEFEWWCEPCRKRMLGDR